MEADLDLVRDQVCPCCLSPGGQEMGSTRSYFVESSKLTTQVNIFHIFQTNGYKGKFHCQDDSRNQQKFAVDTCFITQQ